MNDIDTIREALEDAATQTIYPPVWKRAEAALAALERVSALNSEMEAALRLLLQEFDTEHDGMKCVKFAKSMLVKTEESR